MSVYMIIDIRVKDEKPYAEYTEKARPMIEKHGGRYLVRGGTITPLSGDWNPERVVVIEFPSIEDLRACFNTPEYKEIAPLRINSTIGKSIIVEGIE